MPDKKQHELPRRQVLKDMSSRPDSKPIRHTVDEDGTYIVTYTFDMLAHDVLGSDVANARPMKDFQRDAVRRAMLEFEKVANLRFVEAVTDEEKAKADARFLQAQTHWLGIAYYGDVRDVIISDQYGPDDFKFGSSAYSTVLHEIGHLLGLSHPRDDGKSGPANGYQPPYNTDGSVMPYTPGRLQVLGLGPLDVMKIQKWYGKPRYHVPAGEWLAVDPAETSVLYNDKPLSLFFRPEKPEGYLNVDLSTKDFGRQLEGCLWDGNNSQNDQNVGIRFVPGTKVQDFRMQPGSAIDLRLVGNSMPNCLAGGDGNDLIYPRGDGDALQGGNGSDRFAFVDGQSGRRHLITDFQPGQDWLAVRQGEITGVTLQEGRIRAGGAAREGTLASFRRGTEEIASVFVQNVKPEELSGDIACDDPDTEVEIVRPPTPPPERGERLNVPRWRVRLR